MQERIPDESNLAELTLRGLVLGALITVVFTASNVYLGLKVGLTFASSIPAAVISMAVLRYFSGSNILENNMVQTQASAAGTLSSIIFILPGLLMIGYWSGFPFWQTAAICSIGGILGVLYTIPLRRVMVVQSNLPYPEGVAAAEILRVGSQDEDEQQAEGRAKKDTAPGLRDILSGGLVAAAFSLLSSGFKLLSEGFSYWLTAGQAAFRLSTGFSLALVGAGYLMGITAGIAILIGVVIAWGVAVPLLSVNSVLAAGQSMPELATRLWTSQVRFLGAGTIGIAALWTLATLFKPMVQGVWASLSAVRGRGEVSDLRTERDMSAKWIAAIAAFLLVALFVVFAYFLGEAAPDLHGFGFWGLVAVCVIFAFFFGFLIAAACGYMAGLVGSSSSPISGIGIIAVILVSLLILGVGSLETGFLDREGGKLAIALALFTTSVVIAIAAISNDNLQDLKTGYLVGATPWRQQVALIVGCLVGALVIPPVLELLYNAYGFTGALPRESMDPQAALAAPQATLMKAIASGIFHNELNWNMILIGVALGIALILVDILLRRTGKASLPVLAVGLGIYLPPTIGMTLVVGAVLAWLLETALKKRAQAAGVSEDKYADEPRRRGVLLASGLIVGESLMGIFLAGVIGTTGKDAPLALVGAGFEETAQWLGLLVFVAICVLFYRKVLTGTRG
ncbi:oligopeptide transporter, OPT family [Pseudomonas sp. ZM23]|uniref:Oligopeptide transporter, OPT family n=1 Tax=Pseudomonas triclosanedens TaxID=2961893 RepID=A0ABY6ZX45_9PSED|nr:oligopeptide transporter, OPT family [Pseudomonas triclosanedens]MCP8465351.1 oligopeptide transporter, OPT family [Pseudomonas triclosanedens]MCP8470709.1 oligopeptide transporter, OPT family [Pseudomonas triclosanedens]MCP8476650.1 oligopeptide transporter, OPT family [Pseudomonas triclosanedens]WAI48896.1 oligopeptide transporter, OPT family [Pseudomonas triclosanedens]